MTPACASKRSPRNRRRRYTMTDVLTREQRRLNMSHVRGKDTKPEMQLRRGLYSRGLRYRLHTKGMPSKPDMVFPRHKVVILVHGCFWHGHECSLFKWPSTRPEFWRTKIESNRKRDARTISLLRTAGWRVYVVWECALRGPERQRAEDVLNSCERFIRDGSATFGELRGKRLL